MKEIKHYKLIIFDVDGTVAERGSTAPYLHAKETIERVKQFASVAFATNQGGPALKDADWFGPKNEMPDLETVQVNYQRIADELGGRLYMALAYKTTRGDWIYPKALAPDDPRLNHDWRKPGPGMLLQAMADYGVTKEDTIFVGDREEDANAARAAGVCFCFENDFFVGEHVTARGLDSGDKHLVQRFIGNSKFAPNGFIQPQKRGIK